MRSSFRFFCESPLIISSEKGRANWPLCLDSFDAVFRDDQVCHPLAPPFSSFQGVFREDMNGSLEILFPTDCAPAHDRLNQRLPEQILGRRRFLAAEWLNRLVKCQRISMPNQNARGAVLEIVEESLKVSPITAT